MPARINQIFLRQRELEQILGDVKGRLPFEACGLLFGRRDAGRAVVENVYPMKNMNRSSLRFEVDPEVFYRVFIEEERESREFVGIYHSHPAPPAPSEVDSVFMKLHPVVWLIIGTEGQEMRFGAYQWSEGGIREVEISSETANEAAKETAHPYRWRMSPLNP